MRVLMILCICFVLICPSAYAFTRSKNLHYLVDGKSLKVYFGEFQSKTDKIDKDVFKSILKEYMLQRNKERFEVVADKNASDITVDSTLISYRWLEKDPIDHFTGGTYGLIADALIPQNYAQVQAEFTVYNSSTMRKLWKEKETVSVTQTIMSESDSIPKVLNESAKRFVSRCFGKNNRE